MKLSSFTFHPSPILVDSKPLHGVRVGDSGVTDIQLLEGVLIVSRGAQVWFTHTSYGTGVPVATGNHPLMFKRDESGAITGFGVDASVTLPDPYAPKKQRSKKQ